MRTLPTSAVTLQNGEPVAIALKIEARIEEYYPFALGVVGGAACIIWGAQAFTAMLRQGWDVGVIYSATFDLMTIFTAFLFTFFSFFVTTDRGFIGRAKGTLPYRQTVKYTLKTLALGALLIALSIPMMVIKPAPTDLGFALVLVSFWLALAIWTAASFFRAAHIFSIFASQHL